MTAEGALDPEEIELTTTVGPGTWVAAEELDGEMVLYDEDTGAMHVLNPSASAIWSNLDADRNLGQVAEELASAFQADAAVVREDVVRTVRELGLRGLLQGVARPAVARERPEESPPLPRFLEEPPSG